MIKVPWGRSMRLWHFAEASPAWIPRRLPVPATEAVLEFPTPLVTVPDLPTSESRRLQSRHG